jgi:hypothetical protein
LARGEDAETLGQELIEKAREAVGGMASLAEIKDYVRVFTWGPPGTPPLLRRTVRWMASGPVRLEDEIMGERGPVTVLDGAGGWTMAPGSDEPTPLDPQQLATYQRITLSELLTVLGGHLESGCTVEAAQGKAVEISCPGGVGSWLKFGEDGLPTKRMIPRGEAVFEEVLSDWRSLGSLRLPFRSTMMMGDAAAVEEITLEWRLNVGLTAEELRKLR